MTTAELGKQLAKTEGPTSLQMMIQKSVKELGRALPSHLSPERLVRIALTCIRLNPELARCTPESFLGSLFVLAQVGLEPIAGRAYLLPFNNKRKINGEWQTIKEVQALIGYKGLAELFYRHEKSVLLSWGVVRENDEFQYEKGTNAFLKHKPAIRGRGNPTGFWVMAELQGGGKPFEYMSLEDCVAHGKKHSKTYDKEKDEFYSSSPWAKDREAMCLKTVLIQLAKLLPLSVELQRAIAADETSRDYRDGIDDALDITPTTSWDEPFEKESPTTEPIAKKESGPEVLFQIQGIKAEEAGGVTIWCIESRDKKKYWTDSDELSQRAGEICRSGQMASAVTEKEGSRVWIKSLAQIKK